MGSTRLPGKVLKELYGKTVLAHDIERVKQAKLIDEIIVATTVDPADDSIVAEAQECGVKVFRGSEADVLSRYYLAATEAGANVIVRITSDCPLIDPHVMDDIIHYFVTQNYDLVTNAGNDMTKRTFPRGLDVEVFSYAILKRAYETASKNYQREHVTPFIYENSKKIYYYINPIDYSQYRWTLDTDEDWELIRKIYGYLYHGQHDFYLTDILNLMQEHSELYDINKNVEQKKL